jgi:HEAT repeat protein
MGFYQLSKEVRRQRVAEINTVIHDDLRTGRQDKLITYFSDEDTYIRKTAYLAIGKIYITKKELQPAILHVLEDLAQHTNEKVRQTAINAAGEVGIIDFAPIESLMEKGLFDVHHSVRNAVIGSVKKMGEKNPKPVLTFAKRYLHHEDKEIRREICHGIELRGRTHPQDILPLLKALEHDKTARVRNTLVHVLGQISYKKGCLATVIAHLKTWQNDDVVKKALDEIIDVHERYKDFSTLTQEQARAYINTNYY